MATQVLQSFNYALPLTKSDTNSVATNNPTLPLGGGGSGRYPDAIWVGGAGIVVVVFEDESTVQITVAAGTLLPIRCKRINSTTTSASLFVGLWML